VIERWCTALGLPASRLTKDWEFYEDASRKLVEVRQMTSRLIASCLPLDWEFYEDASRKLVEVRQMTSREMMAEMAH
jgi:hypothetical protein